jgi:hypothetical protein
VFIVFTSTSSGLDRYLPLYETGAVHPSDIGIHCAVNVLFPVEPLGIFAGDHQLNVYQLLSAVHQFGVMAEPVIV